MSTQKVAEVFPLGHYLAEELDARGWSSQDLAIAIENTLGREVDGLLIRAIQIRQLEIEMVIACSSDRNCYSDEDSLRAFARGLDVDWRFLDNLQRAYRDRGAA